MKRIQHIRGKGGLLRHLDWYLIANLLFIFGIGVMNLISATSSFYSGALPYVTKQLVAFLTGSALALAIIRLDYRSVAEKADWIYWVMVVTAVVLGYGAIIPGIATMASSTWGDQFSAFRVRQTSTRPSPHTQAPYAEKRNYEARPQDHH